MNILSIRQLTPVMRTSAVVAFISFLLCACSISGSADSQKLDLGIGAVPKKVSFDVSTVTLTEGSLSLIQIVLDKTYSTATVVSPVLMDPTHRFQALPVLIAIPANTLSSSLVLQTNDDSTYEGTQTFMLTLSSLEAGVNTSDALINITLNDDETPPATAALFTQVTGGRAFTCGLATTGDAYCFGERFYGNLGDGTMNDILTPAPIVTSNMASNKKFTKVSVGMAGSCGIAQDGVLHCWGSFRGALGSGATESIAVPTPIVTTGISGSKTFIDVATYNGHACGVTSDHIVYCWGANTYGQLGDGTTNASALPVAVNVSALALVDQTFSNVTTGNQFSCGLTMTKKVYCWGQGTTGALGNNAAANSNVPVAVNTSGISGSTNFSVLVSGGSHSCAIMDDNATYCWGSGGNGRLGYGATAQKNLPFAPNTGGIAGFTRFKKLALGYRHTCGITNADELYCWGANSEGRIGDGTTTDALVPTAVNFGGLTTVKNIAAGYTFTCAQKMNDSLACWGAGVEGQLGNGVSTVNTTTPIAASATASLDLSQIVDLSINDGACVRFTSGDVSCWGASELSQLGTSLAGGYGPVKVDTSNLTGSKKFIKLAAGNYHICGIGTDQKIYCWGYGYDGETGTGVLDEFHKPTAIDTSGLPAGITFSDVHAGGYHTCALASNNKMYCWGYNSDGQLGNNSTVQSAVPVAVDTTDIPGNKIFIGFDTGTYHTCAIAQDFAAHCWGWGGDSALGYGGTASKSRPYPVSTTPITGSTSFSQITAGMRATCAVMSDGEAYCWGAGNVVTATAAGTTTSSPSIVSKVNVVTGSTTISSIAIGEAHGCMRMSDNGLYCFGYNAVGQLCNGTFTNATVPIQVTANFPAATEIYVTRAHSTFVLGADQKIYGVGWGQNGQLGGAVKRNISTYTSLVPVY